MMMQVAAGILIAAGVMGAIAFGVAGLVYEEGRDLRGFAGTLVLGGVAAALAIIYAAS